MVEPGEPVAVVSGSHRKKLLARAEALLEGGDLDGRPVLRCTKRHGADASHLPRADAALGCVPCF